MLIQKRKGRVLLADEMGLGKTIQAVAFCQLRCKKRPVLIICPASLKYMWKRVILEWLPKGTKVKILRGKRGKKLKTKADFIIINYDILPNKFIKHKSRRKRSKRKPREVPYSGWIDYLMDLNFQIGIVDEAHYIKHNRAYRTKACKRILKSIKYLIMITGTPIVNRPEEAFNSIHLIDPDLFGNWFHYVNRYCGAKKTRYGWWTKGATNTKELNEKLASSIMIRRRKKDVLKDLPPKTRTIIPLEIDNRKEYTQAENEFIEWVKKNRGEKAAKKASHAEEITKMEYLKQIAIKGKMRQVIEWIENYLESGNKLVVFCTHRFTADLIYNRFEKVAVKLTGGMGNRKKDQAEREFQKRKGVKLLVGIFDVQGKPAGTGKTLTAAPAAAFVELQWSPGIHSQAEDRIHRLTQKAKYVNIYYLVSYNTVEEDIANMLDEKLKVTSEVLDGEPAPGEDLLAATLAKYSMRG